VLVGEVPGTDVRLGVVATDQKARLFFCGGPSSYATRTKWFETGIDASGRLVFERSETEKWGIDATFGDGIVEGSVDTGDGRPLAFRAIAVRESTIAGLYEATAPCGRVGLIVAQPTLDEIPAGQGACVGPPTLEQVNPLSPIVRAADGTIRVVVGTSPEEILVRAAAPPQR